jgi:hypothetical protein
MRGVPKHSNELGPKNVSKIPSRVELKTTNLFQKIGRGGSNKIKKRPLGEISTKDSKMHLDVT